MYDQLSSLDTSKTSWRIKVRVTRMWASVSAGSEGKEGLKGINLILLDDDVRKFYVHIQMLLFHVYSYTYIPLRLFLSLHRKNFQFSSSLHYF